MPVRKGKNARPTRVHDNSRRPKRGTGDWFAEQFEEYFDKPWDATNPNEQIKETDEDTNPN